MAEVLSDFEKRFPEIGEAMESEDDCSLMENVMLREYLERITVDAFNAGAGFGFMHGMGRQMQLLADPKEN